MLTSTSTPAPSRAAEGSATSGLRRAVCAGAALLALLALSALSGCQKPAPPHITPKEARVVAVGAQGLEVALEVEATNPNGVTLSVQSVTARAKLDGRWDMGAVTIAKPIVLPPNAPAMIDVPLTMPWTDLNGLATLVSAPKPVPYSVEGSAKIGGEHLNVDVPFTLTGTISRDQLVGAAMKALPGVPLPALSGIKLP